MVARVTYLSLGHQRLDTHPGHHLTTMLEGDTDGITGYAPTCISLLVLDEATVPGCIVTDLEREVIHAHRVSPGLLSLPHGPESLVIIAWLPAIVSAELAAGLVNWRDRRKSTGHSGRSGLIGCAPLGGTAEAERTLAAGFDDIMVGRISVRELAGRIRALMRRLDPHLRQGRSRIGFAGLTIERDTHCVWFAGRRITLTRTELDVMADLVAAAGQIRTRSEILDAVRTGGGEHEVSERAVDNVILRLRRKLGDGNIIETVRGVGFRLTDESAELSQMSR